LDFGVRFVSAKRLLVFLIKSGVECKGAGLEVHFFGKGTSFLRSVEAIHTTIFPFDRKWAGVANIVKCNNDFLEVDITVTQGSEVPESTGIRKVSMAAKNAYIAVATTPPVILHVDVVNSVREVSDEFDVVYALITKV